MNIWVDAQLSPSIAAWINRSFDNIKADKTYLDYMRQHF